MTVVPRKTAEMIAWANVRAPIFTANAAALGLTAAQADAFAEAAAEAQAALTTQDTARESFRIATEALQDDARDLRRAAGDTVKLIKAFADNQEKPGPVYQLAQIPQPQPPAPLPPPGIPSDLSVSLLPEGFLQLRWKCVNPPGAAGTVYLVERRIGGGGSFAFRAAVGERRFIDDSVPGGSSTVEYKIRGQRADAVGIAQIFTVRFGIEGGGFSITAMTEDQMKLAA